MSRNREFLDSLEEQSFFFKGTVKARRRGSKPRAAGIGFSLTTDFIGISLTAYGRVYRLGYTRGDI